MKKYNSLLLIALIITLYSCQYNKKEVVTDSAFGKYVQAFTSGTISTESVISVYLAQPVTEKFNDDDQLFIFKPEIKGKTVLVGNRVVEFRPSKPLKGGTTYNAQFNLGKIMKTEKKLETMPFSFSTIKQSFSINFDGLKNMIIWYLA